MRYQGIIKNDHLKRQEGFDSFSSSLTIFDKKTLIEEEEHNWEANKMKLLLD